MSQQNILLVDDDHQSLRLMEVSLRKAGFAIQTARNGTEALARIAATRPAMVIADTDMPGMDGFELCTRFKGDPRNGEIPFVFLTEEASVEAKVRGLELGADDYLTRPIFTRELIARVKLLLEKHKRRSLTGQHRFFGDLAEMSVVDLMQTIEIGGKSGRARIEADGGERVGVIWFLDGAVADADAGGLTGEEAIYRLLNWDDGSFEMDFRATPPRRVVDPSIQALILEGMRRIDEWSRIEAQLPALSTALAVDPFERAELDAVDDDTQILLERIDGRSTTAAVIAAAPLPDLAALQIVQRLYFEGVLVEANGSIAPAAAAPPNEPDPEPVVRVQHTEPPPRVRRPVVDQSTPPPGAPRSASRAPATRPARPKAEQVGLVDTLIRSAVNQPAVGAAQIAAARAARPDPALAQTQAAPPTQAAPTQAAQAPQQATQQAPQPTPDPEPVAPVAPIEAPVATHEAPAEEQDLLDSWASGGMGEAYGDEALFGEGERPVSRAAFVAVGLLLVTIVAVVAFLMRDTVKPFQPTKKALNSAWHTTALQARKAPGSVAPVSGDWTLPASASAASMAPAPLKTATISAAPDSAAPDSAAPASAAAPTSAKPAPLVKAPLTDAPAPKAPLTDAPSPAASGKFAKLMNDSKAQVAKRRFAQAASTLAQAVKLQPKNADAHLAHADALLEAGKDDAALAAAQKAIRYRPSTAKAHLIIGTIYQLRGKKEAAIDAYDRFLKLAPKGRNASDVRRILDNLR